MKDELRRSLGSPAIRTLTRVWSQEPHRRVRTLVDPPHIAPRRLACPTYRGDPGETVICVGPNNSPVKRSEVREARVHDEETLLGAAIYVFGKQAPDAARSARLAEEIISDSLVIALSKIRRAEAEHGVKALIPEGLVYYIVRGALRHRSLGDGRPMTTESGQAREKLMRALEDLEKAGTDTHRPGLYGALAEEIRDSYPKRRRPTRGYELSWREIPRPHLSDELVRESSLSALSCPAPSAETTAMGRSDIPEISAWQDADQETPGGGKLTDSYALAILHAGAPLLTRPARGARSHARAQSLRSLRSALDDGPGAVRELVSRLGSGSTIDLVFDLSDRDAIGRLQELVSLCGDTEVVTLLRCAADLAEGRLSRAEKFVRSAA